MLKGRLFPFALELVQKYFVESDGSYSVEIDNRPAYEIQSGGISVEPAPVWVKVPAAIFINETSRLVRKGLEGDIYEGKTIMYYDPRKWREMGITLDIQTAKISFRSNIFKVVSIEELENIVGINKAVLRKMS